MKTKLERVIGDMFYHTEGIIHILHRSQQFDPVNQTELETIPEFLYDIDIQRIKMHVDHLSNLISMFEDKEELPNT